MRKPCSAFLTTLSKYQIDVLQMKYNMELLQKPTLQWKYTYFKIIEETEVRNC